MHRCTHYETRSHLCVPSLLGINLNIHNFYALTPNCICICNSILLYVYTILLMCLFFSIIVIIIVIDVFIIKNILQ